MKPTIGWREFVSFPDWGISGVQAKVDTGARTSALHVDNLHRVDDRHVRFEVVLSRRNPARRAPAVGKVVRISRVRTSTGHRQTRYVVSTRVRIGDVTQKIELSLVRREKMLCRMLLGRSALDGFLVDPTLKHLHGARSERAARRKHR